MEGLTEEYGAYMHIPWTQTIMWRKLGRGEWEGEGSVGKKKTRGDMGNNVNNKNVFKKEGFKPQNQTSMGFSLGSTI